MELLNKVSENDPVFCPKVKYMDQTVEKYRIFCSNGCGRSYIGRNRKYNLKHHLKYKCGVNPQFQLITLNNLNVTFSENHMKKFLNMASLSDPAFCPNGCNRSYKGTKRKSNLKRHLKYSCGMYPKWKCIVCQNPFKHNHTLQ
ncbi:unnamed protein product [Macrosiphum euphorbiae]|uniref:C2H2-type domain-containing protein n=1 Tax=Macrosiphum euphorbiae TaxID=13131 RepID=A0AAV0XJK3_9HEMI|nr:unnamed protein product [Macrosiphum euphorbiae]